MNTASILTTARKELRSYFLSPVALIFLGVFLVATLFIFFTYSKFFARNLADVRPLFNWLPLLLIFLVSAVTMRQWSEEQKMGTLEILLTLPIKTSDLVLGKFAAGMALVALALGLTLPLPFTVAMLGELDWGPVVGGYVAALLLASTYMAIGLCVSARTDNQIVALMVTAILGGLLYLLGSDALTGFFATETAEVLRGLGTGSRFSSIERGVLDLRDLAYYGSLTVFFLLLNVHFLEMKRLDKQPAEGNSRRPAMLTTVALAGLNVLAVNLWLAPVTSARADLTADGEYSINEVTEGILARLDEPLVIQGFFSEKTHPLLSPLVPRVRDFLTEYEVRGSGNVKVEFFDPNKDEALEEEISDQYGIKSVPFRVSERHEESVVNSYFHILIKYGDEYEVLQFGDLIEVYADDTDVQVRLRSLEYDITRAIKKVSQGFQSLESVLARNDSKVEVTAYVTPDRLPPEFAEVPKRLQTVADELAEKTGGRVRYEAINPDGDQALQQRLQQQYGFRPMAADLFGQQTFYLHILVKSGDRAEQVYPQGDLSEGDLRTSIEASIKRLTPGFLKTVGLVTKSPAPQQPQFPGMPPQPHGRTDYRQVEQMLGADFTVRRLELDDGVVPGDIDVVIIGKTELDEKAQFALDQYLMRGGAIIAFAGAYDVEADRQGITAQSADGKLLDLLDAYGVKVQQSLVMDPQNTSFPVPVREQRGPYVFERIEMIPYPFFADIRREGFAEGHAALAGVPSLAMTWASPIELKPIDGVEQQTLLRTSPDTWLQTSTSLQPDFQRWPEAGFGRDEDAKTGEQIVAVTAHGSFPSYFADRPSPIFVPDAKPEGDLEAKADRTGRTMKTSTPEARLVVVASSEFAADLVGQLGMQMGGGGYRGNAILVRNLIDWTLEDTDLLTIRSAGAFARTLKPLDEDERTTYEVVNYALVLAALVGVLVLATTRRKMARPIPLENA